MTPREKDRTAYFMKNNFGSLHQTFLATHDTVLINELACFRQMDQMARAPIQKLGYPLRYTTTAGLNGAVNMSFMIVRMWTNSGQRLV